MKRVLVPFSLVFVMFFACAGAARAQEITQADRDKAVQSLESTKQDA